MYLFICSFIYIFCLNCNWFVLYVMLCYGYFQVMKFQVESKNKYDNNQFFDIVQHKSCECGCKVNTTSVHKFLRFTVSPAVRVPSLHEVKPDRKFSWCCLIFIYHCMLLAHSNFFGSVDFGERCGHSYHQIRLTYITVVMSVNLLCDWPMQFLSNFNLEWQTVQKFFFSWQIT